MRYYSTIISIFLALIISASAQVSCTQDPEVPSDFSSSISVDTSSITRTSVKLLGFSANLRLSQWGFEQSADNENWELITANDSLNTTGYYPYTVSSLVPGSIYYFRFYSKMEGGMRIRYSQSLAIKTKELSSPTLSKVSLDGTSCSSSILDDGGRPIWSVGFIISNSSNIDTIRRFGKRIEGVLEEDGKAFNADIEEYDPGKNYFLLSYASNYDASSIYEGYSSEPLLFSSVSSVSLGPDIDMLDMYDGETFTLTATILPTNATNQTVTWNTSDPAVATVSPSGVVTAINAGTATITVTTQDGGFTASCNVNVTIKDEIVVPDMIDLGLSVMWGSFNLGADTPEGYGSHYAWGETIKKSNYSWSTYKYCNGSDTTLTKYCDDPYYGYNDYTDHKTVLDLSDDVARVKLGGSWRIPTYAEWIELIENCTWHYYEYNNVFGFAVVSNINGNWIFLPNAGYRIDNLFYRVGSDGLYSSSSLCGYSGGLQAEAVVLPFIDRPPEVFFNEVERCDGLSVRPVYGEFLPVESVSLSDSSLTLTSCNTYKLFATVKPANALNQSVIWSSNNNSVATVSSTGLITAVNAGIATITATTEDGGFTATCQVTVLATVSSITLSSYSKELYVGELFTLNCTIFPSNAEDKTIIWDTSDATVATVSQTGDVMSVGIGSCTITAKATSGVSASCTCNVVGNPPVFVFEDNVFKNYIYSNFDKNNDGFLSREEVLLVTNISCRESAISSLSGIEYFPNVRWIYCDGNRLTSLDVSSNPALQYLCCHDNQLTSLDVSRNSALESLICYDNQLTSLDISRNSALETLNCNGNQLTSLDVSRNSALKSLQCDNNQLTSLDVSSNLALKGLTCNGNQLTSLDVSKNSALESLQCANNQFTSLDISRNSALETLNCNGNQLTSLDVSRNSALEILECGSNQLASLDVSRNSALKTFLFNNNPLTSLDVSNNSGLVELYCFNNQLTSLDVSSNPALEILWCLYNPSLTEIWLKTGQTIKNMLYDSSVSTIYYK